MGLFLESMWVPVSFRISLSSLLKDMVLIRLNQALDGVKAGYPDIIMTARLLPEVLTPGYGLGFGVVRHLQKCGTSFGWRYAVPVPLNSTCSAVDASSPPFVPFVQRVMSPWSTYSSCVLGIPRCGRRILFVFKLIEAL